MRGESQVIDALPARVLSDIKQIGRSIARARKARGLTQSALADRMFVSRNTLHRLESGDPSIGLAVLASALFILGRGHLLGQLAGLEREDEGDPRKRADPRPGELDF